ncbi:MAG: DUF1656 domain-containing protein [Burkholderiales bacterium]|nr:DUF1656 domain-containing protein [Burkholderiales bacterium]
MKAPTLTPALGLMLGGCAKSPSINVLGAFFPDWLFCIVGAILLTLLVHTLLTATGWIGRIGKPALPALYPIMTVLFALAGWLLIFQN